MGGLRVGVGIENGTAPVDRPVELAVLSLILVLLLIVCTAPPPSPYPSHHQPIETTRYRYGMETELFLPQGLWHYTPEQFMQFLATHRCVFFVCWVCFE